MKKIFTFALKYILILALLAGNLSSFNGLSFVNAADEEVTLRVCNWEEYIDLGDWDEDDAIDLESGVIYGERSVLDEFVDWYYETYGIKVNLEYSCLGTNEEMYNMLTLGNEYDLMCPSEYMIMKLMSEGWLEPYSDDFFNKDDENNFYVNNVSPFIENMFKTHEINGETWDKYAAGYMWGVTGILYNPDKVTRQEASTWNIISNPKFKRQITIKDNVRDSYFAALGALKSEMLLNQDFINASDYDEILLEEMNDVSPETIEEVQDYLQEVKNNVYSFESDSGKADMITGKVLANYQWSGDAVYAMDQAEDDEYYLEFAVPCECTDLYFDGWVMLKNGINGDAAKKHAAEAFVNYMSRPDNAIRNMYYIGYTSVISGNENDNRVYEYIKWNFEAEEDCEDTVLYDVSYMFSDDPDCHDYTFMTDAEQTKRQLFAQYPSADVIDRSTIMQFFDKEANGNINQMWINVRCYNLNKMPIWVGVLAVTFVLVSAVWLIRRKIKNK